MMHANVLPQSKGGGGCLCDFCVIRIFPSSMADAEKDQGNGAFKEANYNDAIIKYTNAIAICPLSARTKQSSYYRYTV